VIPKGSSLDELQIGIQKYHPALLVFEQRLFHPWMRGGTVHANEQSLAV
jgi:hypothetical protein